jgi:hypothetical protein
MATPSCSMPSPNQERCKARSANCWCRPCSAAARRCYSWVPACSSSGPDTHPTPALAAGGQASTTSRIENYLGFPTGVSGTEFGERALLQAQRVGAEMFVPHAAVSLSHSDGYNHMTLDNGAQLLGKAVIIATGAHNLARRHRAKGSLRLHSHGRRHPCRSAVGQQLGGSGQRSVPAGDQPARRVRGRRRSGQCARTRIRRFHARCYRLVDHAV